MLWQSLVHREKVEREFGPMPLIFKAKILSSSHLGPYLALKRPEAVMISVKEASLSLPPCQDIKIATPAALAER